MTPCSCCSSCKIVPLLDLGKQPICNRFLESSLTKEAFFPLEISICNSCGLITLTKNIPYQKLQPKASWIYYKEPEAHLNHLVDQFLLDSPSLSRSASILGLSYHDQALINRFRAKNFINTSVLSLVNDLANTTIGAGIETIQALLTPSWAEKFLRSHKKKDIIIARAILEHTHDIGSFLKAIKMILAPGGHVIFEVPDFSISLSNFEYSNIWEEHSFYFTPATFTRLLQHQGFTIKKLLNSPYPLENSMTAICQVGNTQEPELVNRDEISIAKNYALHFEQRRKQLYQCLKELQRSGEIAIFGAGHLAIKFINLFDLSEFISFIADDHPDKCGLHLPGSQLPIKPTSAIFNENIRHCLLSINPDREDQIMENCKPLFVKKGITSYSIFSASSKKLPIYP